MSNETFFKKQQQLISSHLEINKHFHSLSKWDREEIEKRSKRMADIALMFWPYFGDEQPVLTATSAEDVTGKSPQTLIMLGQRIPVKTWRDVLTKTLNTIADIEPELFEEIATNYPRFISKDPDRFSRKMQLDNEYYVDVSLNAKNVYRFCEHAIETAKLSREDWRVETN